MEGHLAEPTVPEHVGPSPVEGIREAVLEGGTLTVCTQCAVRRGLTQEDLLPGVRIAGAPKFVEEIMTPGTQALVY